MVIAGEGTAIVRCSAKDAYEFVLDLERYRQADRKVGAVHSVVWHGSEGEIHYSGCFRGWTTPAVRQTITVEPYRRIDVRSKPGTLAHAATCFHGVFTFDELGDGTTRVFHREELDLHPAVAWLLAPLLRDWLAADTPEEVARMKELLASSTRWAASRRWRSR
jgi:hypothetical protein